MAAARGRSIRSRTAKGRLQNDEDIVRLDYRKDPADNLREILGQLCRADVSKTKKLGYYNAFVRLRYRFGLELEKSFSKEEILVCLRHGLFHRAKEIRTACLRALRYFCQDFETVKAMVALHIDYLIVRSLDICLDNEMERVHVMRLIRKVSSICPDRFPPSLLTPMISIANDGTRMRDKLVKTCLATICELALHNAKLVARYGGIGTILHNVLECHQLPRVNESLMATILNLLNHPRTRPFVKLDVDIERILAPFTDFDFKYATDTSDQSGEDSEFKYDACKMALGTIIKSWPGLIRLCKPDAPGLQSLIGVLYLRNMETRKEIMDVLFDVFRFSVPLWTDNFAEALTSIDPSEMNETWKLSDGFLLEEGKSLLPHLARTRPNLVENHMAIILSAFISAGLLEALTETITTSSLYVAVRATILLGELLNLSTSILPDVTNHYSHCLPLLVERAADFRQASAEQSQAALAITCLSQLHCLRRRSPRPCSLFLTQLLDNARRRIPRVMPVGQERFLQYLDKDRERELINQTVRDSQVLYTKDNHSWDWKLVATLIKWPDETMRRLEDQQLQRFVRRLVFLFKPSNKVYSVIEIAREDAKQITTTGVHLFEFLTTCKSEEGQKNLKELLTDIKDCLTEMRDQKCAREVLFTPSSLTQTCSQYYFLFIGKVSSIRDGDTLLEQIKIYETLMNLMKPEAPDMYIKLILSCLDYSHSNHCRKILFEGLTSTSDTGRLYATGFMRILLRARLSSFSSWGIDALLKQLSDPSKPVAMEALSVLSEACDDLKYLSVLVKLQLSFGHLGHKGDLMFARILSSEEGFNVFSKSVNPSEPSCVRRELDRWHKLYNLKYVHIVEERLTEALTTYEKTYDGSYVRRSHRRVPRKEVFVPVHLYGQLVQHEKGAQLLADEPYLADLFDILRYSDVKTESCVLKVKAALWAAGHIGRSSLGVALLQQNDVVPTIINLAEDSGVFTIRGTAVYVLGLIATTSKGSDLLHDFGWESVRHARPGVDFEVEDDSEAMLEEGRTSKLYRNSYDWAGSSSIEPSFPIHSDMPENYFGSCSSCPPGLPSSAFAKKPEANVGYEPFQSTQSRQRLPSVSEGNAVENAEHRGLNQQGSAEEKHLTDAGSCTVRSSVAEDVIVHLNPEILQSCSDFEPTGGKIGVSVSDTDNLGHAGSALYNRKASRVLFDDVMDARQSCSDMTITGVVSGISSFGSEVSASGVTPDAVPVPVVCSSLDTATQSLLGIEQAEAVTDSAGSLRRYRNLQPAQRSAAGRSRTSQMLTGPSDKKLNFALNDSVDQKRFSSSQDLEGYHALRELKPRTSNRNTLVHSLRPTSLAKTHVPKTRSLDFRYSKARVSLRNLMPKVNFGGKLISSCVGLRPLRTVSFDELNDVPSKKSAAPQMASLEAIPKSSPDAKEDASSSSLSSSQSSGRPEYLGICVPVHISMIFQVNEGEDGRSKVTEDYDSLLRLSKSEYKASRTSCHDFVPQDESTAYAEQHHVESCLGCYKICRSANSVTIDDDQGELSEAFSAGAMEILTTRSSSLVQSSSSRKCSTTDAAGDSVTSQTSAESVSVDKGLLSESTTLGRTLIRKEVLRLVINLASSVGVKSTEQGLLIMKQKFPAAFQDLCLYSEVCILLKNYSFRLGSRRFVQELFQDLNFDECMKDPHIILGIQEDNVVKFSEQIEVDHHLHEVLEY